jgi:hypothetical protein
MESELDRLQARQHPVYLAQEMRARVEDHQPEPQPQPQPERHVRVAAPVSRDVPSGYSGNSSTKIRLTRDQCETARLAGISEAEYAAQPLRLNELKAEGHYGEKR